MNRITTLILSAVVVLLSSRVSAESQELELYPETGHTDAVIQVVFSPGGRTLISADTYNTVKLWDVESGQELATLLGQSFISSDGKTIAVRQGKAFLLWDVATWRALRTLPCDDDFCSGVFSPDGKTITVSGGHKLSSWDVASGREIYSVSIDAQYATDTLSPDGRTLIWWAGATISFVEIATGRVIKTLKEPEGTNPQPTFSPNRATVAWSTAGKVVLLDTSSGHELLTLNVEHYAAYFSPDWKTVILRTATGLRLWDVASGRELNGLKGPNILDVLFSPDGKTIAFTFGAFDTLSVNLSVATWGVESGQNPHVLKEHVTQFPSLAFIGDGKTVVVRTSKWVDNSQILTQISMWEMSSGRELHLPKGLTELTLSPDGKTAAAWVAGGNIVSLLDTTSWREVGVLRDDRPISQVNFYQNGKTIVSFGDGVITVWDAASREKLYTLKGAPKLVTPFLLTPLIFSPDSKAIVAYDFDTFRLWSLRQGASPTPLELKRRAVPINLFALSPDGKTLAIWGGRGGNLLKLWDVVSGKPPRTLLLSESPDEQHHARNFSDPAFIPARFSAATAPAAPSSAAAARKKLMMIPSSLIFSPDGKMIVLWTPTLSDRVFLWDVESGRKLYTLSGHDGKIGPVVFSPDGTKVASGGGTTIRLWDAASGAALRSFKGYEGGALVFSPDGRLLASAGADNSLKLWNINSGWSLQTAEGHKALVKAITFAPDGETVATASDDQSIKLWDASSGRMLLTLVGHADAVNLIAFSPDGKVLASESSDGTAKLWDVSSGQVLKTFKSDYPKTPYELYSSAPGLYAGSSSPTTSLFPGLTSPTVSPRGTFQIKAGENGKINLLDLHTGKVAVTLVALENDEWIVTTPEGRFDTNKPLDRIEGLHWVINGEVLRPLPLDIFMRQYYEPDLLRRVLSGERLRPLPSIAGINRIQPEVAIRAIKPARDAAGSVNVTVEVSSITGDAGGGAADGAGRRHLSSGVFDVRLFRDGQLVGHSTPDKRLQNTFRTYGNSAEELTAWREANRVETDGGKHTFTFRVKLPANPEGMQVEFSAYAFNDDRVKSETARMTYALPAGSNRAPEPRTAYIITFGVNKFDNPEWDLQFASNDARAMRDVLSASLRARNEFAEVVEVPLISDGEAARDLPQEKRGATKGNAQTVFDLLSGKTPPGGRLEDLGRAIGVETLRKIRRATPDDMVLVSFSSHGYVDGSGVFYIVPSDIGEGAGKRITPSLLSRLISSDELSLWMRDVDAGEMVMIVDACHSASAVEGGDFKPGPMGSRGLGQLAFDKGMRVLTATQSDNIALENKIIKQGLLTYALVQDGIKAGQADYKPMDKVIKIDEWLSYGVERVPKLYEELRSGNVQSFGRGAEEKPEVVLVSEDRDSSGRNLEEILRQVKMQQPSLFDFNRKHREVVLVNLQ